MTRVGESPSAVFQLEPDRVAEKLTALANGGTINEHTLVVWDVDDTLIQQGSDYSLFGAQAICLRFSEIIRMTQKIGTAHIALTNASRFDNALEFEAGVLKLTSAPQLASTDLNYIQKTGDANGPLTFEKLRIAGLKHIGVDFTAPEWQKLPRELEIIQFHYDIEQDPNGKELAKIIGRSGEISEVWIGATDRKVYRRIQWDAIVPGFEPNHQKRHFIQSDDSLSEVICQPIFSGGIIFGNFINFYTQCYCGTIKGTILESFLKECEKRIGRRFSNVVFIDDTFACIEDMAKVMKAIDMPCIAINILSHPENFEN
jgi:hypothetical protein